MNVEIRVLASWRPENVKLVPVPDAFTYSRMLALPTDVHVSSNQIRAMTVPPAVTVKLVTVPAGKNQTLRPSPP